jgi:hypothetical protein
MLATFQSDMNDYNEQIGMIVGWVVGALLLVFGIVWLIKRSRKG